MTLLIRIALVVCAVQLIACATTGRPTSAGRFSALVIGISYQSAADNQVHLLNTLNDARLIANRLSELQPQFNSVRAVFDPNTVELRTAVNTFSQELDKETTAVFFYAGHGVQIKSINYLLAEDLDGLIKVTDIIGALKSRSKGVVVILDACRNNPFESEAIRYGDGVQRGLAIVGIGPTAISRDVDLISIPLDNLGQLEDGLARIEVAGSRIMIVFATDPGDIAADAAFPNAKNSPFSHALGANIGKKKSFAHVLNDVAAQMELLIKQSSYMKDQIPWRQSSWTEPLYFAGKPERFKTGARRIVPPP